MTIRFSTIVSQSFQDSFKRVLASTVPAKTGLWLAKISKVIEGELQLFNEQRNLLFKRLGQPIEGQPDQMTIPPDKVPEFMAELESLDHDIELGLPEGLKLKLPETFVTEDWSALIALDLFEEPT